MCVGQMSSTAAQCVDHVLGQQRRTFLADVLVRVPIAAIIGREMPGPTAGARMGCNRSASLLAAESATDLTTSDARRARRQKAFSIVRAWTD